MGDVGSTFLGAVFAGLVLQAPSWYQALGMLLVATPLLGDAFFVCRAACLPGSRCSRPIACNFSASTRLAGSMPAFQPYITATALLAISLLTGGLPWVLGLAAVEMLVGFWLDQRVLFLSRCPPVPPPFLPLHWPDEHLADLVSSRAWPYRR